MNKFLNSILKITFSLAVFSSMAQNELPKNWFNLDSEVDGYWGGGVERTYKYLLNKKKSSTVIVAVIDAGVEIDHPDLKDKIWINTKEISGNKIDDDGNGYIDDVNGWDFIGGDSLDVAFDNLEETRIIRKYISVFEENKSAPKPDREQYKLYLKAKKRRDYNSFLASFNVARYQRNFGTLRH